MDGAVINCWMDEWIKVYVWIYMCINAYINDKWMKSTDVWVNFQRWKRTCHLDDPVLQFTKVSLSSQHRELITPFSYFLETEFCLENKVNLPAFVLCSIGRCLLFHMRRDRLTVQVPGKLKDMEVAEDLIWRGLYYDLSMFTKVHIL